MPAYTSNPVTGDFFANGSWVGGVAPDPNGIDTTTLANGAALTVATGITGNLGDPANPTVPAIRTASNRRTPAQRSPTRWPTALASRTAC